MKSKLPRKKIVQLTWWLALSDAFIVFLFIILFGGTNRLLAALFYSTITFLALVTISFINFIIRQFLEAHFHSKSKKVTVYQYIVSYMLNGIMAITANICFSYTFNLSLLNPLLLIVMLFIGFIINTQILVFQNYIILYDAKRQSDLENYYLKTANAEAANQLLRQQIHPHFLFNSLNTLKSLYKKDPVKAEGYLISLSDFLRVSISNSNIKIIRLKEELKLCKDYLDMQKIRFGESLFYTFSVSDDASESGNVPSFSLQPLIENAIKHNELSERFPLHIKIKQENDRIVVTNNLQLKTTSEESTGSGLANLSERYRFLSNDDLVIENDETFFSVSIKILNMDDKTKIVS